MSEVKNIPRLRFPEFDQNWKQWNLGDLCIKIQDGNYGGDYPKPFEFKNSGVPFLTSKAFGGNGVLNEDRIDYISETKHSQLKKAQLKLNDVLFTNRGSNVGTIGFVDERIQYGNIGPQLTLLRSKLEDITPLFLKVLLETNYFKKQVRSQDSGSAMNFYGIKATSKFKLKTPSLTEQQKIADFLTAVDKRIKLLEKKKILLETYKKGVMKKIFNQEIRFKDDNGNDFPDWEEKRLDEISKIYQPKTISQNQFTENGYVVYGANGPIGFYSEYNHETPQVVVTCRGNSCGTVNITTSKSWITGNGMVVNVDDSPKVSKNFIYFYLLNDNLTYLVTGSGQPQITGDLKNHKINLPTEIEQIKISEFLSAIDSQIELLKSQIDKSRTWKKGLLQKMFV